MYYPMWVKSNHILAFDIWVKYLRFVNNNGL